MEERITSMIPRYGKLNKIYAEIISGGSFSFEKQQFISDFYREYGDTQTFETALISLMLEADAAHFSILLNSLKREIEGNISTYSACKEFFDCLDTGRYDRCKREYDKEKAKLDELYRQKEQARREALQCLQNRCGDICRLGGSLLAILDKYLTDQKKKEGEEKEIPSSGTTPASPPAYFPMRLLSAIYEKCNDKQFEAVPEADFYARMNLQPCRNRLKIRPGEKARVCYLIFLMGETLSNQDREKWKDEIMRLLDIDIKYYKSKYKAPVPRTDLASDSNQEFAKEMRLIFR